LVLQGTRLVLQETRLALRGTRPVLRGTVRLALRGTRLARPGCRPEIPATRLQGLTVLETMPSMQSLLHHRLKHPMHTHRDGHGRMYPSRMDNCTAASDSAVSEGVSLLAVC